MSEQKEELKCPLCGYAMRVRHRQGTTACLNSACELAGWSVETEGARKLVAMAEETARLRARVAELEAVVLSVHQVIENYESIHGWPGVGRVRNQLASLLSTPNQEDGQ